MSFHRAAFTDDTFQRSLALEEDSARPFCVRCHAPPGDEQSAGVGCLACHEGMNGDATHTGHRAAQPAASASTGCAHCHQFAFDPVHDGRPDLVQKTVAEHAASPFADVACVDCHMPRRAGARDRTGKTHLDHSFPGGHAPGFLRSGVHLEARRVGEAAVRITIRSDAGHAFPTGDMFRRSRLLVFGEAPDGTVVASAERVFGRTWGRVRGGKHAGKRTELDDTRIRGLFEEQIDLGAPVSRVHYLLVYERILAMRGEGQVTLISSDVLTEGDAR